MMKSIEGEEIGFREQRNMPGSIFGPMPEEQKLLIPMPQRTQLLKLSWIKRVINFCCSKTCWNFLFLLIIIALGSVQFYNTFRLQNSYEAQTHELEKKQQEIFQLKQNKAKQVRDLRNHLQALRSQLSSSEVNFAYFKFSIQQDYQLFEPTKIQQALVQNIKYSNESNLKQVSQKFGNKFEFYSQLFTNWMTQDQMLDQVEYFRLNQTYDLDAELSQRRMCIMSPYKNLLKYGTENASFHMFLKSLNAQNYSNYHVYMIDDASTDNSANEIVKHLSKYPRLSNRLSIIKNRKSVGALANRDFITRKYCRSGDVVMDIDGDDALIGKQVFNLFNREYQKSDVWFLYSNFIQIEGDLEGDGRKISMDMRKAKAGPSAHIPKEIHESNTYRTEMWWWCTSELRTYLYDLYIKIPVDYLIDKQTGKYYLKGSDRYVMYALTELAGPRHTKFLEEYPYFYYQPNYVSLQSYECLFAIIQYYEAKSRMQTPFLPLKSLQSRSELTQNYQVPLEILDFYLRVEYKLLSCLKVETQFKVVHSKA